MAETTIGEGGVNKKAAPKVAGLASQAASIWGTLAVGIAGATIMGVTLTLVRVNDGIIWAAVISFLLGIFCFPVQKLARWMVRF